MTQSETQERLKQIRERSESRRRVAAKFEWARVGLQQWDDIDFLLSLIDTRAPVDSQGTEADEWRTVAEKYQALVARTENDTATQMRTACVEKVRTLEIVHDDACSGPAACTCGAENARQQIYFALSSLTLDQVKQK